MQENNFITFLKNIIFLQLFLIVIIAGVGIDLASINALKQEELNQHRFRLPLPVMAIDSEIAVNLWAINSVALTGQTIKGKQWLEQIGREVPQNLMVANLHIPVFRGQQVNLHRFTIDGWPEVDMSPGEQQASKQKVKCYPSLKNYKVVLYCTHNGETYIPDSGKARKDGERGLVNKVAAGMAGRLESAGMQAEFINHIHDYPDYDKSYTNSRETVKKIIKNEKRMLALLDIHRDSIPGKETAETININGQPSALILMIVGTDERKEHPYWKKNMEFAEKIHQQGEKMYPGLIKGVRTKSGTYNQEFFDHTLLLEVGSDYNSFAEANYAGELFTDILLEVLEKETDR